MGMCNSVYTRKAPRVNHYQEGNGGVQNSRKEVQTEVTTTGSGVIFEMEEAQDEINIPAVIKNYPPILLHSNESSMKPPNNITWFESWKPQIKLHKTSSILSDSTKPVPSRLNTPQGSQIANTIREVEYHASKAPRTATKTFPDLVKYLTMNLINSPQRDMLTVRAIIAWLSSQNLHDMTNGTGSQDTPKGFLILLGQKKTTYSTFFTVLCRKAKIKTVQISGISKFGQYQPGNNDTSGMENNWNAVYVKGEWKLIHAYRACVSLSENSAKTWIKLTSTNKEVTKNMESSVKVLQKALKEYYTMTSPREFLYTCHPHKRKWQMLENPMSRDAFLEMPYLLPTFFGLGLKLKSKQNCLLKSVNCSLSVEIECPLKNARTLDMWYELIFIEEDTKETSGGSFVDINDVYFTFDNLQKYVTMIRNGEQWKFIVRLPVEGSYRLIIYSGPHRQHLLRICEFRLECEQPNWGCMPLPFNPGIVGFGPGPFSEQAGLYIPSHRNGLIFTGKNCGVNIVFQLEEEALNDTGIKAELIQTKSGSRSIVLCDVEETTKVLRITTTIPEVGDYILAIATGNENNLNADILDENDFTNICNYYITEAINSNFEHANKANARKELSDKFESEDKDVLQRAIDKCIKEKIEPTDDQILAAKTRLGFLEAKTVIKEAFQRRNTGVVDKALHFVKASEYKDVLKTEIDSLEKFKVKMESSGNFTQFPPHVHESLSEVANITKPHIKIQEILRALLILLGEPDDTLQKWENVVELIRPGMGRNTALYKIKAIQECRQAVDIQNAKKADNLLRNHKLKEIQRISMAAATIFQWTSSVIDLCLNGETLVVTVK